MLPTALRRFSVTRHAGLPILGIAALLFLLPVPGDDTVQPDSLPPAPPMLTSHAAATALASPAPAASAAAIPGIAILNSTVADAILPVETGPYNATFQVKNTGNNSALFMVSCTNQYQIDCSTISPDEFTLAVNQVRLVTVYYTPQNLGSAHVTWTVVASGNPYPAMVLADFTVIGTPIPTHLFPMDGYPVYSSDTIRALLEHPVGVSTAGTRLLIDGINKTSVAAVTDSSVTAVVSALGISLGGSHLWQTVGCSTTGRCDTTSSTFTMLGPPSAWELDDSLPETAWEGYVTGQIGGLPLPPNNLRGCPVNEGDPEIGVSPGALGSQAGEPQGLVFTATTGFHYDTLTIYTVTIDHPASDTTTCASYTYAPSYNWNWWHTSVTDPLYEVYPYADYDTVLASAGPSLERDRDPWSSSPIFDLALGHRSARSHGGVNRGGPDELKGIWLPSKRRSLGTTGRWVMPRAATMLPDPGDIDSSKTMIWLNGTLIVENGVSKFPGTVTVASLTRLGAKVHVLTTSSMVHKHDALAPNTDNGGWNEIIAQIADTSNHTTKVRGRYVQLKPGVPGPITVSSLRDFSRLDQGECAAFGAFQCGGLTLTQAIPGFVTRDKGRGLDLIYRSASQRAPTILPTQVLVDRYKKAPDTIQVRTREGGTAVGDSLRYGGLIGGPSSPGYNPLWEDATERRAVAGLMNAASGNAAVRTATVAVTHFYNGVPRVDSVSQAVLQLYLSDTLTSRTGKGWQLAQISRLITTLSWQGAPARVLLSGDGSYVIYRQSGGLWVAPTGETASLQEFTSVTNPDSARYVLALDNGARVGFRIDGWQAWTADLVGNRTNFTYIACNTPNPPCPGRISYITDPAGIRWEFAYGSGTGQAGNIISISIRPKNAASARLMANLDYDTSGRLTRVRLHRGGATDTTQYAYHATTTYGAFLTSVTDPRSTASAPIVTKFAYDSLGLFAPVKMILPTNQGATRFSQFRDQWRRAAPRVGYGSFSGGQPRERLVQAAQLRGTHVNGAGLPIDYTTDRFGYPTWVRVVSPPVVQGQFWVTGGDDIRHITRDSIGRVTKIVRAQEAVSLADSVMYHYDAFNRLDTLARTTVAYPWPDTVPDRVTFVYDSVALTTGGKCHRTLRVKDPLGGVDSVQYGAGAGPSACLPIRIAPFSREITLFTYSGTMGPNQKETYRPVSVTDPAGIVTNLTYDTLNWNVRTVTRASDSRTTAIHSNKFGRPDSVIDPWGGRSAFWYDSLGRVTHSKTGRGALAPVARTTYLPGGLVQQTEVYASTTDAALNTPTGSIHATRYFYDRLGQVDSTLHPGTRPTSRKIAFQARDAYGVPFWEYPGNGSGVQRVADQQGRIIGKGHLYVEPHMSVGGEVFADAATKAAYSSWTIGLGALQYSGGQAYSYAYDRKGRLIAEDHTDSRFGPMTTKSRSYSPAGLLVWEKLTFRDSVSGAATIVAVIRDFKYNRRGQRTEEVNTTTVNGVLLSKGSGKTTYYYNNSTARLDSIVGLEDAVRFGKIWFTYDAAGRDTLTRVQLGTAGPDTVRYRTQYDAQGRRSLYSVGSSSGLGWYGFTSPTYTPLDDLRTANTSHPGGSLGNLSFVYDSVYHTRRMLTSSAYTEATGTKTHLYTYNVFGNRVKSTSPGCTADSTVFESDDRILRRIPLAGCGTVTTRYWSDHAGNRLMEDDTTWAGDFPAVMTYTAAGQLAYSYTRTAISTNRDQVWNWYDGSGMRIMSHNLYLGSLQGPSTQFSSYGYRTFYVYDGADVGFTIYRVGTSYNIAARYLRTGLDRALVMRGRTLLGDTLKTFALALDHQGSPVAAVKSNGQQEMSVAYFQRNAFGALENATGTGGGVNTDVGFAGGGSPSQTGGFTYFRNRWYDPATGRFLTQDPIGLAGGVNLYAYAGNNPIAYTDPFGLCPPADENYSDCSPGSSGWYANRLATGQGNVALNWVGGTLSTCGESTACQAVLAVGGIASAGVRMLAGRGTVVAAEGAAAEAGGEVSSGALKAMQSQLETAGRKSVEKTIRTLTRRIAEHEADIAKYRAAGGNVSSMEREVRAWRVTIEAARTILE